MKLGDVANEGAAGYGKPLDGVRVLAAEQMQALPYATQLLARLGADVVKVEHPTMGDSGRGSSPFMLDPDGRKVGATYLRNNFNKRSVGIDLKAARGPGAVPRPGRRTSMWWPRTSRPGRSSAWASATRSSPSATPGRSTCRCRGSATRARTGTGRRTPRSSRPCRASTHYKTPDGPPTTIPVGALGDISSALFAVIGILAALRHRDRTGEGQHVDIAMLDAMVAMTDMVTNFWSLGARPDPDKPLGIICEGFRVLRRLRRQRRSCREHQFAKLADLIGKPEWHDDPRFADRYGWEAEPRVGDPPRHRGVVGQQDASRGGRRAQRGGHRVGPEPSPRPR